MLRRPNKSILGLCACLSVATLGTATPVRADSGRDALADSALDQSRDNPSLYQSAPITHVIPAFNTITYAFEFAYKNVTVTPQNSSQSDNESLKLGGYTATPYLAVSLRYLGLGFSAEDGQRTAAYSDAYGGKFPTTVTQKSEADYTALGVYLYLIPFPETTTITPTVIFGVKDYNVSHSVGYELTSSPNTSAASNQSQGPTSETFRYSVTTYEFGLNVGVQLLKRFMLIPWVDYTYVDTREAQSMSNTSDTDYQDDLQLFWHADPAVRYGLDFAIKIDRFQIHLGSVFGALAPTGQSVPYIQDRSISLSLSIDQKGS